MKYSIDNSFIRDAKRAPRNIQLSLKKVTDQVEKALKITDIPKVKKMSGHKNAYRIRIDDHRIGFYFEDDTIVMSRILARKEIYKYFPNK